MEDIQIKDVEMATIYKVRLAFLDSEKKTFTVKEIGEFLDNIAMGKEQEK